VGAREEQIARAIALLGEAPQVELLRRASLYETEPVGVHHQRWFINTVVELETTLSPQELLDLCKRIERALGRVDRGRWGPREIDLDLLLYGELVLDDPDRGLVLPHPELHRRRFVLVPLVELAPELVHPKLGVPLVELLANLTDQKRVRRLS